MSDVPSNLIPTRVTQLPLAPVADENSLMMIVYQGNNYQIRVGDLLSVAGVPTSRQVIAGTGLTGGGQLSSNVTLSIAVGGVGTQELASTGVTPGTYGNATSIPVFTVDAKGRVQAAGTVPVAVSGYVPVTRQVIAGTGLTGGGALNANVTLDANLSNSTPLSTDGLGSPGVSTAISRADHQHPSVNLQNANEVDGVLPLSNGGTARSIVPDAGAIIWCGADGLYVGPVGVAGQALLSGGTGEYTWHDVVYSVNGYTGVAVLTYADVGAPATDGTDATGTWNIDITGNAATATNATHADAAAQVDNAVTFSASGGAAPGTSFNGSAARTVDYSTVGAPKADGTGASGTWNIAISGNAATATLATAATNLAGGAANRLPYQTNASATGFIAAPTVTDTFLKWNGSSFAWSALPGAGTVTSVGLALPSEFTISNSPVTSSGTLTGAWASQNANLMLAGPTSGAAATPTFRALVNDDLPASGVTPDTYGSTTEIPVITVNAKGVVTSVTLANIVGGLSYQGSWDASTNSPALASGVGTNGFYYIVSVAGTTNLDGITDWQIGDWAIFNGATWQKIDQTNLVSSVNGQTGVVVLGYADVGAPSTSGTNATGTWAIDISGNAATATSATSAGSVTNSVTFDNSGTGGNSPQTFNGSAAVTISRNTLGAAASGANSDITSMSGITGAIGTADYVAFDTAYATPLTAGQLGWDGNNTLGIGMAGGNVVQHIGEDSFYYIKASSTITKGEVIMFTGSVGASGVATGAPATGVTDGSYIMGVAAESIALNGFGLVQFQGTLRNVNTSGYADGDILWYDPAVTGGLTKTKPSAPNVKVQMAAVINGGSSGGGTILIRVNAGSVLGGTDSNVQFGTLADKNLIQYNSTAGYWQNVTPGSVTGVGSVANAVTFNSSGGAAPNTTFDGSTARTVDYSTVGAPKADGTGASGTWSINISGNAATATSATSAGSATTATTATNVAGGTTGALPYNSAAGTTTFLSLGTTNYVLTAGATAPQYVAQSTLTAGAATNLAGGAASQIPYQTGSGATTFLANGTAGQVLKSNGASAPSWAGIDGGTF